MTTIAAETAEIRTATVEIQTLRVGQKQVTQSVFKQIQDESVDTLDRSLWGTVNYHWPGCDARSRGRPHRHLLWQKGHELRRMELAEPWVGYDGAVDGGVTGDSWLWCACAAGWPEDEHPNFSVFESYREEDSHGWDSIYVQFAAGVVRVRYPPGAVLSKRTAQTHGGRAEHLAYYTASMNERINEQQELSELWRRAQALDQLFIAV